MQVDLFGAYVESRLDGWGRAFALHRDCEYLGHQSQNVLQTLIDHAGEMPERPTGFRPLEVDPLAHEVELIVTDIAGHDIARACAMRAYYCGAGRRGVERLEIARELIGRSTGDRSMLGRRAYFGLVDLGRAEVRGALYARR